MRMQIAPPIPAMSGMIVQYHAHEDRTMKTGQFQSQYRHGDIWRSRTRSSWRTAQEYS